MKRKERKSPRPTPKRRITHELLAPRRGVRLGEGDKLKATSVLGDWLNSRGLAHEGCLSPPKEKILLKRI